MLVGGLHSPICGCIAIHSLLPQNGEATEGTRRAWDGSRAPGEDHFGRRTVDLLSRSPSRNLLEYRSTSGHRLPNHLIHLSTLYRII